MSKTNPFRKTADNAASTAKKWDSEITNPSVYARICPLCGAPRPVNSDISYCSYCRYNFMSVDINIERKHE
ncbi:hypothetical protein M2451_000965 [Dysgonomonas sp. PFB1-18]|uniref:hypothetical protein n=1 Tax=unclassified Dysgonomonas TaxID=2630389 RepID=UPI002473928B|nr:MULTISPECIES: hypothetical protein [unclassified Dysgonomonas]MDH6308654.1 hypothetical protein [Dysgonomonas sp. PF1-14]MDH6338155.1 hypothetical protein [Dysgonomonas sp. PF1-16]MDH6379652.1 hypothetical protein [Dysgonomonas sp. PFB1-18]MDH6396982.1 hypothetical protein [Dysgonomonas sp. PF1-23]